MMFSDYRDFLKGELLRRCHKNARYSQRAFARDLGLPPHRLSEVLNRKQGLSKTYADQISRKLDLDPTHRELFCDLISKEHSRSPMERKAAEARVALRIKLTTVESQMNLDVFQLISGWQHLAILELMALKKFKSDEAWIARKLGISIHECRDVLARLKRLKLIVLTKNGVLRASRPVNEVVTEVPSKAIQEFHEEVMKKSMQALATENLRERDFRTTFLALSQDQHDELKQDIHRFNKEMLKKYGQATNADRLYAVGTQMFRLDQKEALS